MFNVTLPSFQQLCSNEDARLVSITDEIMNEFVASLIPSTGTKIHFRFSIQRTQTRLRNRGRAIFHRSLSMWIKVCDDEDDVCLCVCMCMCV